MKCFYKKKRSRISNFFYVPYMNFTADQNFQVESCFILKSDCLIILINDSKLFGSTATIKILNNSKK